MGVAVATAGIVGGSSLTTSRCLPWPKQARRHLPRSVGRSRGGAAATMSASQGAVSTASLGEGVRVVEGNGGLPVVKLSSAGGSEAELYLFGGCVTSWTIPSGKDLLFVRPDAVFDKKKPISGGIPHCFPQFGPGPIQQHGFARNLDWSVVGAESAEGDPTVTLELRDNPYSRAMWDFSFRALYKVTLSSKALATVLTITNTDSKPFSFCGALHTYFRASIEGVLVRGLRGCRTLNKDPDPVNPLEGVEEREAVAFPGFVDCIYLDAPGEVVLENGLGDALSIRNSKYVRPPPSATRRRPSLLIRVELLFPSLCLSPPCPAAGRTPSSGTRTGRWRAATGTSSASRTPRSGRSRWNRSSHGAPSRSSPCWSSRNSACCPVGRRPCFRSS